MTPIEACEVAINYCDSIQDAELVEILEKVIAGSISDLIENEGASFMLDVLESFMNA